MHQPYCQVTPAGDGERINFFCSLAFGEWIGKAGLDLSHRR
jgi:hypothetical protein